MICKIVALVVVCSGAPIKTSPTDALRILGPPPPLSISASIVDRKPTVVIIGGNNPRDFPEPMPRMRLDGSLFTDLPWQVSSPSPIYLYPPPYYYAPPVVTVPQRRRK